MYAVKIWPKISVNTFIQNQVNSAEKDSRILFRNASSQIPVYVHAQ